MTPPRARQITALEPDPHHPGAVRVLVDGRPFCTVHQKAVPAAGLAVGQPWDDERSQRAGQAADEEGAWRSLLRALERRSFAIGEIRRRLRQKGHPPAAVEYAITRAQEARLLDDAAFARQFAESRAARGRGPARLRLDLRALGVDDALINAALAALWPEPGESLALAAELVARRSRQLGALPRETKRRRLLAYLARRGFSGPGVADLVTRALSATARVE
jgi:regulatory protein